MELFILVFILILILVILPIINVFRSVQEKITIKGILNAKILEEGSSPTEIVKEKIPESIKDDISKYDLGDSLKRLKKMYSDGHLTKVEFEKAKNKLLK
jgi:hypothetical protein|tara:strand:- start:536 stop:832 length:297 start_codon:yes stop_codon:yes gene_type:complete